MKSKNTIIYITSIALFLLAWQALISFKSSNTPFGTTSIEAFIPTPLTIVSTLINKHSVIVNEFLYTISRSFVGLFLGLVISVLMNALFWFKPNFRKVIFPISLAINSFPLIGFSPLIIMLFGQGSWLGIVFISTLICYFPILISLENALSSIDSEPQELGKTWGASKSQLYLKIQLPLLLPYLFNSLKLAIPASIIGATLGEWLGSDHGIGRLVIISLYQLDPGTLYACLVLILIFSMLSIHVVSVLKNLIFPWMVYKE